MKAIVLVPFRAKHDHKVIYAPGDVKEFDNDRVAALAARGLVKPFEETPTDAIKDGSADSVERLTKSSGKGKGKGKSTKKDKETPADVVVAESEIEVANSESDKSQGINDNSCV